MGRPIYDHELSDPDFVWLIDTFKENSPFHTLIEVSGMPLVFIAEETEMPAMDLTDPGLPSCNSGEKSKDKELIK